MAQVEKYKSPPHTSPPEINMEAVTAPLIASNLEQLKPPTALCCPFLMARGPLFESEYILGSAASRSVTVMDWWVDGWTMQVRLPQSFFLYFFFFFNTADFSTGMSGRLHRAYCVMLGWRGFVLFYFSSPCASSVAYGGTSAATVPSWVMLYLSLKVQYVKLGLFY